MSGYRYKRFTTRLLFRDLRFPGNAAAPGDPFPAFDIVTTRDEHLVNQDLFDDKPVLFVFGSMTCPMTASSAPSIQELHDEFGEQVDFVMLYVREAHPGENYPQAETMDDKLTSARALQAFYGIDWTVAADTVAGDLHRALDPKPNAAYLVGRDGKILFRSLWAADYDALRQALDDAASGRAMINTQSTKLLGPVVRAMGRVSEVMERGGPQAVTDLWRAGLPMALAGRIATLFKPLPPDQRGIAAVSTLVIGMLVTLGLFATFIFD
jgi:thiol-disulfide isomerase/thioredoxin